MCFEVQTGVYILGILDVLGFGGEVAKLNPVGIMLLGASSFAFLSMWQEDTKENRKLYFFTYSICKLVMITLAILFLLGIVGAVGGSDVGTIAEKTCSRMSA